MKLVNDEEQRADRIVKLIPKRFVLPLTNTRSVETKQYQEGTDSSAYVIKETRHVLGPGQVIVEMRDGKFLAQ